MSALADSAIGPCAVRSLGRVDYLETLSAMQAFTVSRNATTTDQIWLLEHAPVYTAGLNARAEHFPLATEIPLIECDRGGQITYHGPGQLIAYCLFDLQRLGIGVRQMVHAMEEAVIELLAGLGITAQRVVGAPGVYVGQRKIAALGLRIRRGCSYHGLSLNVDMDLTPFNAIDPCGYRGLEVTQLRDLGVDATATELSAPLAELLTQHIQSAARRR